MLIPLSVVVPVMEVTLAYIQQPVTCIMAWVNTALAAALLEQTIGIFCKCNICAYRIDNVP